MPVNIEIKSRCNDFTHIISHFASSMGVTRVEMRQEDTFFNVPRGKLKMRCDKDGQCELIYYRRSSVDGIMTSSYHRQKVEQPMEKTSELRDRYGIAAVVRKHRIAFIAGHVRVHLDEVESLGKFLEIEVLANSESERNSAKHLARKLMSVLHIEKGDLIEDAYEDLLCYRRSAKAQ